MNEPLIAELVEEIRPVLRGRPLGKVFQLGAASLAIDFRLPGNLYLFLSVEPQQPRLYLIKRTVRELEKASTPLSPFVLQVRKIFGGAMLESVEKTEGDRIIDFRFRVEDIQGRPHQARLIAQLTGRSANLLALDEENRLIAALRPGPAAGSLYAPPATAHPPGKGAAAAPPPFSREEHETLSEAADHYYRQQEQEQTFRARAAQELARLRRESERRRRLRENLARDLVAHGDAERHRREADLLLANLATAERAGRVVRLRDYFAEGAPLIELEVDEGTSLPEEAERRFARYGKAKRAGQEITKKLEELEKELARLEAEQARIERAVAARDFSVLAPEEERPAGSATGRAQKARPRDQPATVAGARRYRSSDGYEMLVGRRAQDNDRLTFRVARPHDLWLHAADYPGSHVVVLNHSRRDEVPHRTVMEAAQLAAYFSQARQDAKVNVHYAPRKFISKPKGAAPGLVRLSSFRTLLVEPREAGERL